MVDNNHMKLDSQEEKFMLLFSLNRSKIYRYILSVLGRRADADDIMQQTLLVMWRTFSRFEENTNFATWGKAIAKYQIMTFRRKQAKELLLDSEALQKILDLYGTIEKHSGDMQNAMDGCLKKLDNGRQELLRLRYCEDFSCKEVASKKNRPVRTIYKQYAHLHALLQDCISSTLRIWGTQ